MDVIIPIFMLCANGVVYVFDGLPHPVVALMRIKNMQQAFPAALTAGFEGLVDWLRVMGHREASGASNILATNC